MAATRYPRLKLAISALSTASVIAGAAYFRSAQDESAGVVETDSASQTTMVTTGYRSTGTNAATSTTAAAPTARPITTTARTSRGS